MADFQSAAPTAGNAASGQWPPNDRNFSPLVIPPAFSPQFAPLPSAPAAPAPAPALVNFVSGWPPPHPPEFHANPLAIGAPLVFAPFAAFPPSFPAQPNGFEFVGPPFPFAPLVPPHDQQQTNGGGNSLHTCPCCPIAFTCPITYKRHVAGHFNSTSDSASDSASTPIGNRTNNGARNGRGNGTRNSRSNSTRNSMVNPGANTALRQTPPASFGTPARPQMLPERAPAASSTTTTPVQPNGALGASPQVCAAAATPTGGVSAASPAAHSNSRGGSPAAHSIALTAAAPNAAAAHDQLAEVNLNNMMEEAKRVHENTNRLLARATARASPVGFDGAPVAPAPTTPAPALASAPIAPAPAPAAPVPTTDTNVSSTNTPPIPAPHTNVLAANGALPVVPLSTVSSTTNPTAPPSSVVVANVELPIAPLANGSNPRTEATRTAAKRAVQPAMTTPATPASAIPAASATPARPVTTPASNSTPMNQSNVSNRSSIGGTLNGSQDANRRQSSSTVRRVSAGSRTSWNETVRNLDSDLGSYWTNTSRVQSPERSKSPDDAQPAEYFSCCVEGCVYFFTRASSRNRHESASHGLERQPEDLAIRGMPTKEPKRHFVEPLPMRMPSPSPPRAPAPAPAAVLHSAAKRIKREGEVGEPSGQPIAHAHPQPHQHQATPRPAPLAPRHQAAVPQQPQAFDQGRASFSARPQVPPLQQTAGSSAPPPPRVAATPRTPLARPQPAAQPAGVVAAPQRPPILPAAAATHDNQQPAAMRPIKAEANANNAFVPPPQPLQSSTARCFKLLSQSPPIVYYDYQAMHELYGTSVIQMWKDVPECKVLLLRLEKDRWEQQQPDLGDPVLTCSMIRYYLPRNENRNAHLSAYFKPSAAELAIKLSSEINSSLSFEELVTDVLPAMNTDTLVIAHPTEASSLQNFDTRGTRLRIV